MDFDRFEREARAAYAEIPGDYLKGIDGLRVEAGAPVHPDYPEVFTLGECVTEAYPSGYEGPETVRSQIVLYHGSFRQLAKRDRSFDWQSELWETITHEVRHHLESLADEDDLEAVDYAVDQEHARAAGDGFDPWYYQHGDDKGDGLYVVEGKVYMEFTWDPTDVPDRLELEWLGQTYVADFPGGPGDVHFLDVLGLPEDPWIELVLVRRGRGLERLRRALGQAEISVTESETGARLIELPEGAPGPERKG